MTTPIQDQYAAELARLNKIGATCWQRGEASIVDFEPLRMNNGAPMNGTRVRDMDRFRLQVDGPTMIDAQVLPNGRLKILYNACRRPERSLEDEAFNNKRFDKGEIVTFHQIERQFKVFVRLCNGRLNNASWQGKKVTYNPVTHKVRIRVAS
jgi:hypothetical protein|tara:strand:- start:206 stop:661 length:456 start_codon:yes stop_codon:yes gene_type:complete